MCHCELIFFVKGIFSNDAIFFTGDKESGKTTLIAKLQGNEDPKKGAGLEYGYIDVRDEYRDGKTIFVKFFFEPLINLVIHTYF